MIDLMEQVMEYGETSLPHYAVFDCDWSVNKGDCAEAVINYMAWRGFPGAEKNFNHYYALLEGGCVEAAYKFGASMLNGLTEDRVREITREALAHEGTKIAERKVCGRLVHRGVAPRASVVNLIRACLSKGIPVWIVSASSEIIVRATLKYFGLEAGVNVIGIRNINRNGIVTAELEKPFSIGENKVKCIQRYIHPTVRPVLAVGDSMGDYAMLKYCSGVRVVIDRGNELARKARAKKWAILEE